MVSAALAAKWRCAFEPSDFIAAYIEPNSDRAAVINELITLFDGSQQREAQKLTSEALAGDGEGWHLL